MTSVDSLVTSRAALTAPSRAQPQPRGPWAGVAGEGRGGLEGKIEVSPRAIATIAARAAAECYGVAGLAPRHAGLRPVERLAPEHAARGVEIRFVNDHVVVEVWVVLARGVRVIEVAHTIMVGVKYAVEEALGLRVAQVNVNVQALASPL